MSTNCLNPEPMLIIGIDPSIREAGVGAVRVRDGAPVWCAQFSVDPKAGDWRYRSAVMVDRIRAYLSTNLKGGPGPALVAVETPDNWFTEKGQSSKDTEAIQKLYFDAGALIEAACSIPEVHYVYAIRPGQWKGQTPKDIMRIRAGIVFRSHNFDIGTVTKDDAMEALMLAHKARSVYHFDERFGAMLINPFTAIKRHRSQESIANVSVYL